MSALHKTNIQQSVTTPTNILQDDKEVNEYLDLVLRGKMPVDDGLEMQALASFKRISSHADDIEAKLQRTEKQMVNLKGALDSAKGELKAYANILVFAERERRTAVAMVPCQAEQTPNEQNSGDAIPIEDNKRIAPKSKIKSKSKPTEQLSA